MRLNGYGIGARAKPQAPAAQMRWIRVRPAARAARARCPQQS